MDRHTIEMPIRRKVDFAAIALIFTLLCTLVQSTWQASRLNSKVEAVEQRQADRDQEQKQVIAGLTQAVESLRVATAQLQTAVAVLQDRSGGASAREGAR
jgi:cytochrome oxidase assembly protein ShyY1